MDRLEPMIGLGDVIPPVADTEAGLANRRSPL